MTETPAIAPREWPGRLGADLQLALPGGLTLALDWLAWDSRFFGLPCYRLRPEGCRAADGPVSAAALRRAARDFPRCALWAKVPPHSPPALAFALQALGATFIETELTLGHDGRAPEADEAAVADGVRIFEADHLEADGLPDLGRCFSMTRFHTDPRIGREAADALWTAYLRNFRLAENRRCFLAEAGGRVAGAVLAVVERSGERPVNVLDFVAVAPAHSQKGVGGGLIRAALAWSLCTGRPCTVATQHRNTGAIAFYQRNGFTRLVSAVPVFHLWAGEGGGEP